MHAAHRVLTDQRPAGPKDARFAHASPGDPGRDRTSDLPEPDRAWLALFEARLRAVDAVSFAVFDTAITRLVDSPADVFALIEQRLAARLGRAAAGFAAAREAAEQEAHAAAREIGSEGVGIAAIYARLEERLPAMAVRLEEVIEEELRTEAELCRGVPAILAACDRAGAAGKPVFFVSDTRLPAASVARLLTGCGYSGWQELLTSADTLATKASGRQWANLIRAAGAGKRILHVGDDAWSDGRSPERHGIGTLTYAAARSERRVGARLTPAILPFSSAQRRAVLAARAQGDESLERFWRDSGRVLGGIVVGAFLAWLLRRVQAHGIDHLYFCARDGWLLKRAWDAAGLGGRTGIGSTYLYVSRRPLNLAAGFLDSSPERLDRRLLELLASTYGEPTVGVALARARLDRLPELVADMRVAFGSPAARLAGAAEAGRFREILEHHAGSVLRVLEPEFQATAGYLAAEGLHRHRHAAMVDIGWHGSLQASLRRIVEHRHGPVPMTGFYYGLWPPAMDRRPQAGRMEAAFGSDLMAQHEQPELLNAVEILEELHGAPHGTVVSYERSGSAWRPVLADSPPEQAQFRRATRHFQDGVIETVRELFATGRSGELTLAALTPEVAIAAMGAVCLSPSRREVAMYGSLVHSASFDHRQWRRLVPDGPVPHDIATMREAIRGRGWLMGVLRSWTDRADGPARARIAAFARETFPFLGERQLRQLA
jgi:FMN phosphatase YigB (HAD superfamily)